MRDGFCAFERDLGLGEAGLALEYEPGVTILVPFLPDGDDLIYRHITHVVSVVLELKDAALNFDYFAAQA